jgi:hypothetical protein
MVDHVLHPGEVGVTGRRRSVFPAHIRNPRGRRQDKEKVANTLAAFVKSKADQAKPFTAFYEFDAPEDFIVVTILDEPGD